MLWIAGAAAVTIAATAQERRAPPAGPTLYFFFAPDTPRLAEVARAVRASGADVRPVLLVTGFRDWPESFTAALPELGELSLVDEEGLSLARKFGVTRTPCFVYTGARGAHMAAGTRVDLKELLSCGRSR